MIKRLIVQETLFIALSNRLKILTSEFEYRCTASTIIRTLENALVKAFLDAQYRKQPAGIELPLLSESCHLQNYQ